MEGPLSRLLISSRSVNKHALQSQEILNRPVFVLDILKSLNIDWIDSEHYWKFWTWTEQSLNITEHSEHWLNRFWILLKILNILNIDRTLYWKFWTDSEHGLNRVLTFWTLTEQILNILSKYIMWYFTYWLLFIHPSWDGAVLCDWVWRASTHVSAQ